jgi:hypothetical protein
MQTPKGEALMQAVLKTRAAYLEAEEQYKTALIAFDTEFNNQDGAFALHTAAQRSVQALQSYSTAMKEWAEYLGQRN